MIKITAESRHSQGVRQHEYRQRKGQDYRAGNASRMRATREARVTEFVGVDGEGSGKGTNHRYILLGCGQQQIENPDGIRWQEAFHFLYGEYEQRPTAAYVGFFLGYDFNQLLKTLPEKKAAMLLTRAGKARRAAKKPGRSHYSVHCDGWEMDILGSKRLQIRPMCCETPWKCKHKHTGWMSICDTGAFFQQGFLSVIHPRQWADDPDGPVCTDEEYRLVEKGKAGRGDDVLDDDMRMYNRLENEILGRVMGRVEKGLRANGVRLGKNQWYGPGAAAQAWLRNKGVPKRAEVEEWIPEWARNVCKAGYFGGWFEIFSHGLILGSTWNYDINSAYPYAIASLPCIRKGHGTWTRGMGDYRGKAAYVMCHIQMRGASNRMGAVPFRRKTGHILRPRSCQGWYWLDEIQASARAGLVDSYTTNEWVSYEPSCKCKPPVEDIREVYDYRLRIGKNSAAGKGAKLIANSGYGKFAQSIGGAPYNNWFFASRITASCRIQVLDSIATHPGGADSVLMVATDGVVFQERHPGLTLGKGLGEWEESEYRDLVLFMPGVYWHKAGKENVLKVKTRGVPKKEFANQIELIEWMFKDWHADKTIRPADYRITPERRKQEGLGMRSVQGWPNMQIPVNFSMTSCLQALMRGDWGQAGEVSGTCTKSISSDPHEKRAGGQWNNKRRRMDTFVHVLEEGEWESEPYKGKILKPEIEIEMHGIGLDCEVKTAIQLEMEALRSTEGIGEWEPV
jgi:hypothetical protein